MPTDLGGALSRQHLESKRTTRWQVVREVEEKVDKVRKSLEDDMYGASGDGKTARGKWFKKYEKNRDETWSTYMDKVRQEREELHNWRVHVGDQMVPHVHVMKPPPMDVWRRNVWPRNFYCELCMGVAGPGADVLDCRTCNVVMHFRCVTSRFGQQSQAPREWQCEFCRRTREREELEYKEAVRKSKQTELNFSMSIRIQSHVRAWLAKRMYRVFLGQLASAQAFVRMFLEKRKFRQMMNSLVRLYKIKVMDITDMTPMESGAPSATFFVVISVITTKHRQGMDSPEQRYIDPAQQKYRFETTTFHANSHVRLNQQIVVPGSTNQVMFAFTLIRREGVRNEFWGQAIVEGANILEKRTKIRLNLGELKFEPRDRKNIVPLKTRALEERGSITGTVSAEILPLSHSVSKCSTIHEVPEIGKDEARSVVRVWWACLVDQTLLLFKKYGDSLPYRSINILKVSWYSRTTIRVSSLRGDEGLVFTCTDPDLRSDWFNKLKQITDRLAPEK